MATTKNITVTGSSLNGTYVTPTITTGTQQSGITASVANSQITSAVVQNNITATSNITGIVASDSTQNLAAAINDISVIIGVSKLGDINPEPKLLQYIEDQFGINEVIAKAALKTFQETKTFSERITKTATKLFTETTISQDTVIKVVAYFKIFTELVDATDDFYGELNTDDDQYAVFDKILSEVQLAVTEQVRLLAETTKQDLFSFTETYFQKSFDKIPLEDAIYFAEQYLENNFDYSARGIIARDIITDLIFNKSIIK